MSEITVFTANFPDKWDFNEKISTDYTGRKLISSKVSKCGIVVKFCCCSSVPWNQIFENAGMDFGKNDAGHYFRQNKFMELSMFLKRQSS